MPCVGCLINRVAADLVFLSEEAEADALTRISQSPRSLKKVLAELTEKCDLTLSLSTLKRACKRAGLSWKRVRKSLNQNVTLIYCNFSLSTGSSLKNISHWRNLFRIRRTIKQVAPERNPMLATGFSLNWQRCPCIADPLHCGCFH